MGLKDIKQKINEIEKMIFEYSFQKNISSQNLSSVYFDLINIKNWFLRVNFMEYEQVELEEIRYRIQENILNVRIMIREINGLNIDFEINQMKELINSYC
ncbi:MULTISPECIES: hypothetical protein [Tissierella]|jgi:hypothetical protein|uniref:hypothetical protein n=1 Tax=Tissierella TaxID=41273 RepID=UPI001C0FF22D|nr:MULTISPECIES: hypothetical protein [Tissierella]MBU5257489.1 hypothetical protein [Tissierella praeacuta]MBU5428174.1 hypothetical protein [Tissierella pigra]